MGNGLIKTKAEITEFVEKKKKQANSKPPANDSVNKDTASAKDDSDGESEGE